jgi:hypothetical protein
LAVVAPALSADSVTTERIGSGRDPVTARPVVVAAAAVATIMTFPTREPIRLASTSLLMGGRRNRFQIVALEPPNADLLLAVFGLGMT